MAQQHINYGTTANDGTGDTLRVSQQKAESNFTELYGLVDDLTGGGYIPLTGTIEGSPVTGDILTESFFPLKSSQPVFAIGTAADANVEEGADGGTMTAQRGVSTNSIVLTATDEMGAQSTALSVVHNKSDDSLSKVIVSAPPASEGLVGNVDFSANLTDDKAYTQKKYVDDAIAASGGGGAVNTISGTDNQVEVDDTDPSDPIIGLSDYVIIDQLKVNTDAEITGDLTVNDVIASGTVSGSNLSGTNTGDQTSIVGISGTKAQFDAACSDGDFLFSGDVTQYTDEMAQDAVGAMIDSTLAYNDTTPSLGRAAISGDITIASGSNTASIAAGVIVNADINASAAIDATKIANGSVSNTEFQCLDGVTSGIQGQLTTNAGNISTNTAAISSIQSGYAKVLGKVATVGSAHTGNTTETIIGSIAIASGELASGNQLSLNSRVTCTGTSGTKTIRVYVNTTNNLSGSPILLGTNTSASSSLSAGLWRIFNMQPSNVIEGISFNTSGASENGNMTAGSATATFAYTGAFYFIFTGQLSISGDSIALASATLLRY